MRILIDKSAADKVAELEKRELSLVRELLELMRDRREFFEGGMREIECGKEKRETWPAR